MRLSVQLYTLRDPLSRDLRGTLEKVREIGFEYVELAGLQGQSAGEWRTMLSELGLQASGAHVPLDSLETDIDAVAEDAHALGIRYVIVPWIGEARYANGWDAFARTLEPLGRRLREKGLQLAYHNHAFEFTSVADDKNGLDLFYETADPELVKAQLDLAWVAIGGGNPAVYVRKLRDRVPLVHLKDYDPDATPQWVPGGKGKVDWIQCLHACDEVGVEFGAIELDESPGEPLDAVRESYRYFAERGLK